MDIGYLQQTPALIIAIPLIMAILMIVIDSARITWFLTLATCLIVTFFSFTTILETIEYKVISYHFGNFIPPYGIEFNIDIFSSCMLVLVSVSASVFMLYNIRGNFEVEKERHNIFYALFLLALTGLLGIIASNDIFNIYVFIEISSLATYSLVACGKNPKALLSAFNYLIMGTVGSIFYLLGVGLLLAATGTLNITDLGSKFELVSHLSYVRAAVAFIFTGIFIKIAIVPLHNWLPMVYSYGPFNFVGFMSGTSGKVMIFLMLKLMFFAFGAEFIFYDLHFDVALILLGIVSILYGAYCALYQTCVRRILAFSTLSNIGYIFVAIGINSKLGLIAAVVTIINHAVAKSTLFFTLGLMFKNVSEKVKLNEFHIENLHGIGVYMPFTSVVLLISAMSLVGVPLTAGFISKWLLFNSLIEQKYWLILLIIILSSVIPFIYMYRILEAIFFANHKKHLAISEITDTSALLLPVTTFLALINIYLGIDTFYTYNLADSIANYYYTVREYDPAI